MIPVRRARVLPLPSFKFRLAADTLGFGCDLPAAGRSWDFHPLERALAGRTKKMRLASALAKVNLIFSYPCSWSIFAIMKDQPALPNGRFAFHWHGGGIPFPADLSFCV